MEVHQYQQTDHKDVKYYKLLVKVQTKIVSRNLHRSTRTNK